MPNDVKTTEDLVLYESKDRIATITINRPDKMNALSDGLVAQMREAMIRLQQSDDMCAVVTAAGDRAFSVGADHANPRYGNACRVLVSMSISRWSPQSRDTASAVRSV